ncbi:MAG: flagellar hook protein FlgE [Pseudodesulfovibrio sp.]|uniref:Flagellar hook protein FlgE n=1 Tax=Pseudodesulfovibrio aespoeensis (strain ATCC 700646 / DSM 10631 / Aspo-2) TaxID=643562 RepID=E6VTF1_PSEA9|nr:MULTISPECIES: flagellar hook protein FlgE [Pseudodesulfovibrio]MBU4476574.1 flagellar hook protein FlgE [Pseudomonadota bacterium]ADU62128.1 flagellar hook-basal body protein [Pseudodesulfovibrio aespoeensis Aspo-2]MBU4515901.1 flagellar hook protein FlgE [Pseudomonadota bacterium]MBU4522897.1 flagellar hook protein FlgE [Pseudomonadota bacterium]MBU4560021.1 flagellar hook protein FlgE [Pseudomonadota bacterium]
MSITGSMYTGISGLKAQSQATSVVSNNLANSTTTAYKSSSITFEDVFYSTVYAGGSVGQVGNGVTVASVNTDYSQGSYESTNSATDVAINGNGFYVVIDPDTGNTYYTRAGNFTFNTEGYLEDAHGNKVQGWAMNDGSIEGTLTDIVIDQSQSPPNATSEVGFSLNLDSTETDHTTSATNPYAALFEAYDGTADPALGDSAYAYSTTISVFDENGSAHDVTVYFDPVETDDGTIVWEYVVTCNGSEDNRDFNGTEMNATSGAGMLMTGTVTFSSSGDIVSMTAFTLSDTPTNLTDPLAAENWVLADFDADGFPVFSANFTGADEDQPIALNLGMANTNTTGTGWDTSGGISSLADFTPTTAVGDLPAFNNGVVQTTTTTSTSLSSATYSLSQDGYAPGVLINVAIDENGVLSGEYTNGQTQELYTIALANFTNTQGLSSQGSNLYSATTESGQAFIGTPGSAGFGTIASNSLEQSNVDTATELTKLIILQAAYQANAKVITTADTLLSAAISMKR